VQHNTSNSADSSTAAGGCGRRGAHAAALELDQLQPVLSEVAAFAAAAGWHAARSQSTSQLRQLLLAFRAKLAQRWSTALQPVAAQFNGGVAAAHNTSSGCICKSVRLPPYDYSGQQ
jgi:hypothetical protein